MLHTSFPSAGRHSSRQAARADAASDLSGQVVVVAGAGSPLGQAAVTMLAAAGARPVALDRNREAVERLAGRHEGTFAVAADITDPDAVGAAIDAVVGRYGRIDALVNAAPLDLLVPAASSGAVDEASHADSLPAQRPTVEMPPFEAFSVDRWDRDLRVGLRSLFLPTRAAAPYMIEQGRGTVVTVTSVYAFVGPPPRHEPPPVTHAVVARAAIGMTRYLATYWRETGLRVNALVVGGGEEGAARQTTLGRRAAPDDFCGALRFLLSEASSYMTGSHLVVDGGWTAW